MNTISLTLDPHQIKQLKDSFKHEEIITGLPYIQFQIKTAACTITVYNSNKAVFQGRKAAELAQPYQSDIVTHGGSDEVGTGDYFGPVVVCACMVEEKDQPWLKKLKVMDSKQISDEDIKTIAPELQKKLIHSLLVLDNPTYNQIHSANNMNMIKAKLHNQAYVNLSHKTTMPKLSVVDQFTPEKNYFNYIKDEKDIYRDLLFTTKAENKYPAVACASIIARAAFLECMRQLSAHYQMTFPLGSGALVDEAAKVFIQQYSKKELFKVAKLHFKNTSRLD